MRSCFVHNVVLYSGSLIRNNYEALVSHVERLTHNDAVRMLSITRSDARHRTGHTPRTQGEYRRAMESMGEVLIFSAIMGSPGIAGTSYEVCCLCQCRKSAREGERENANFIRDYILTILCILLISGLT